MRGSILDTHIVILAMGKPAGIPKEIRRAIEKGPNFLSVVVYWEVVVKSGLSKLRVGDPRIWWAEAVSNFAATVLPLRTEHVSSLHDLPNHHNDPFDRALIAQAIAEDLQLLSTDTQMPQYKSAGLKLIS